MIYAAILTALADPTRRGILDRLRDGPLAVGRIADDMPVSRPAVSQHLRILHDAGLVEVATRGTRNFYAIAPGGAAPLIDWLRNVGGVRPTANEPVGRGIVSGSGTAQRTTTRLAPAEAWRLFCDDLPAWWPVARVSLSARLDGALPLGVTLDAISGGAMRETLFDGREDVWATVVEVEPRSRLVLDWRLGSPDGVPVTIAFDADGSGGSAVTVAHGDGPEIEAMWAAVMERFAAAANASLSNF